MVELGEFTEFTDGDMGGSGYVMIAAEADYSTLTVANVKVDCFFFNERLEWVSVVSK